MKGDISTSLDDWFDIEPTRLPKADRIKLRALAVAAGTTPKEALRRAIDAQFRRNFPALRNSHDS